MIDQQNKLDKIQKVLEGSTVPDHMQAWTDHMIAVANQIRKECDAEDVERVFNAVIGFLR